jgi:flagellar hook-associated protein 1 FlgK
LEQLSQYGDVTALQQPDGSVTVLLNGQTPLLVAAQQYKITYQLAQPVNGVYAGRPSAQITAYDGTDITAKTTGGQLGALLNVRNRVLPSYLGDAFQEGDLNTLASKFADRVNQLLTPVDNSSGAPVATGAPLFTYDPANAAQTLAINPALTANQLTAIDPGPPIVSNGVPLGLAALAVGANSSDQIDGDSYTQYFGSLASRVGSALNDASAQQQIEQSSLAQAKNLRQQSSGVSLDEEATIMIQFQRAYDANSRLITVLDQITQDVINILGR